MFLSGESKIKFYLLLNLLCINMLAFNNNFNNTANFLKKLLFDLVGIFSFAVVVVFKSHSRKNLKATVGSSQVINNQKNSP